jgi:hypothetical protein
MPSDLDMYELPERPPELLGLDVSSMQSKPQAAQTPQAPEMGVVDSLAQYPYRLFKSYADDPLTSFFERQAKATQDAPGDSDNPITDNPTLKAIGRSAVSTANLGKSLAAWGLHGIGAKQTAMDMAGDVSRQNKAVEEWLPRDAKSFSEIWQNPNLLDIANYGAESVGEFIPQILPAVASGGFTAGGTALAKPYLTRKFGEKMAMRLAPTVGSALAQAPAAIGMNVGESYQNQAELAKEQERDPSWWTATAAGGSKGMLDMLGTGFALRNAFTPAKEKVASTLMTKLLNNYGAEAVKSYAAEGGTESLQTVIDDLAARYEGGNVGKPWWGEAQNGQTSTLNDAMDTFVAMWPSLAFGVAHGRSPQATPPPPPQQQQRALQFNTQATDYQSDFLGTPAEFVGHPLMDQLNFQETPMSVADPMDRRRAPQAGQPINDMANISMLSPPPRMEKPYDPNAPFAHHPLMDEFDFQEVPPPPVVDPMYKRRAPQAGQPINDTASVNILTEPTPPPDVNPAVLEQLKTHRRQIDEALNAPGVPATVLDSLKQQRDAIDKAINYQEPQPEAVVDPMSRRKGADASKLAPAGVVPTVDLIDPMSRRPAPRRTAPLSDKAKVNILDDNPTAPIPSEGRIARELPRTTVADDTTPYDGMGSVELLRHAKDRLGIDEAAFRNMGTRKVKRELARQDAEQPTNIEEQPNVEQGGEGVAEVDRGGQRLEEQGPGVDQAQGQAAEGVADAGRSGVEAGIQKKTGQSNLVSKTPATASEDSMSAATSTLTQTVPTLDSDTKITSTATEGEEHGLRSVRTSTLTPEQVEKFSDDEILNRIGATSTIIKDIAGKGEIPELDAKYRVNMARLYAEGRKRGIVSEERNIENYIGRSTPAITSKKETVEKAIKRKAPKIARKVKVIEKLPDDVKRSVARRKLKSVSEVSDGEVDAWYDIGTGEVTINASAFVDKSGRVDETKLERKIIHEVAIHKGLREAVGREGFDRIVARVWNSLTVSERLKVMKRNGIKASNWMETGEEWLAYEAERAATQEPSLFRKIMDAIREVLSSLGFDNMKLTDRQILDMVRAGIRAVEGTVGEKEKGGGSPLVQLGSVPRTVISSASKVKHTIGLDNSQYPGVRFSVSRSVLDAAKKPSRKMRDFVESMEKATAINDRFTKWLNARTAGFKQSNIDSMQEFLDAHPADKAMFTKLSRKYNADTIDANGKLKPSDIETLRTNTSKMSMYEEIRDDGFLSKNYISDKTMKRWGKSKDKIKTLQVALQTAKAHGLDQSSFPMQIDAITAAIAKSQDKLLRSLLIARATRNGVTVPRGKASGNIDALAKYITEAENIITPYFGGFHRTFNQFIIDRMDAAEREDVRAEFYNVVRDAYQERKRDESFQYDFLFTSDTPKKEFKTDDERDKFDKTQVQKVYEAGELAQSPVKDAEKTIGAINTNVACPMFVVGNSACWLNACYLTQMARGAGGLNYYEHAIYTGELLQLSDHVVKRLNEMGGLRINGLGDFTPMQEAQIRDIVRDAKERGLQLKLITKQADSIRALQRMHDAGIPIDHVQAQTSMDYLWMPVEVDVRTPNSGVMRTIFKGATKDMTPDEAAQYVINHPDAVAAAYKEQYDRDVKMINGTLMRKYGFSRRQVEELMRQNPDVRMLPRWVVTTPQEIAEASLRDPGTVYTFMHGKIDERIVSELPGGGFVNFLENRHRIDDTGVYGAGHNKQPGPKSKMYNTVNQYITTHYNKKDQQKIFKSLKEGTCCQENSSKNACAGCAADCAMCRTLSDRIGAKPSKPIREVGAVFGPADGSKGVDNGEPPHGVKTSGKRFSVEDSAVTPEQDAAYLSAVERGDTEAAQRMVDEAAKKAGYNVGPVWHGSRNGKILRFKPTMHDETVIYGTSFSPFKDVAKRYANNTNRMRGKEKHQPWVGSFYINPGKELISLSDLRQIFKNIKNKESYDAREGEIEKLAQSNGIYAVDTSEIGEHGEVFVFDSSQIKSADPVTRDSTGRVIPLSERFNPKEKDIRYSVEEGDNKRNVKFNSDLKEEDFSDVETKPARVQDPRIARINEILANESDVDGGENVYDERPGFQRINQVAGPAIKDTAERQAAEDAGARIAALFGKQVLYFDSRRRVGGMQSDSIPDAIFVHARVKRPVSFIVGHELAHHLRRDHFDLFEKLYYHTAGETLVRVDKHFNGDEDAYTDWLEEAIGDRIGVNMSDPSFWSGMAEKQPGLFKRVAEYVTAFLRKIVGRMNIAGMARNLYIKDLAKTDAMIRDVMAEYAQRKQGDGNAEKSDDIRYSVDDKPRTRFDQNLANPAKDKGARAIVDAEDRRTPAPKRTTNARQDEVADRRIAKDFDGELSKAMFGKAVTAEDNRTARKLLDYVGRNAFESKDPVDMAAAVLMARNYRKEGTTQARALQSRVDSEMTPEERARQKLQEEFWKLNSEIDKMLDELRPEDQMELLRGIFTGVRPAGMPSTLKFPDVSKEWAKIEKDLKAEGLPTNIFEITPAQFKANPEMAAAIERVIQTNKAEWDDKAFEWYRNGLLSGIQTWGIGANMLSNTALLAWDFGPQRLMESAVGSLLKTVGIYKPGDVQGLAEYGAMKKYLKLISARAVANAWMAYKTEKATLEMDKFDFDKGKAIKGLKGRFIRIPGRALLFQDELNKGMAGGLQVVSEAVRTGEGKGLSGAKLDAFVEEVFKDPESHADIWEKAKEKALELTLQSKIDPNTIHGAFIHGVMNVRRQSGIPGLLAKMMVPFIVTPANIAKMGLRKSPLGMLMMADKAWKGVYRDRPDLLIRHATEQALTLGIIGIVAALAGQDDKKKKFLLTGTAPAQRGDREHGYRTIPPLSFAWKDSKGNWQYIGYGKIEPVGTTLPMIVDSVNGYKKSGVSVKTAETVGGSMRRSMLDKTFMKAVSDMVNVAFGNKDASNAVSDMTSSMIMPNLFKSAIRGGDPYVRDTHEEMPGRLGKLASIPKDTLRKVLPFQALAAPPKVDVYGEDVKKRTGALGKFGRVVGFPEDVYTQPAAKPFDKFLEAWNAKNPDKAWWPTTPMTVEKGGKPSEISEAVWRQFLKDRGEFASKILNGRTWNTANPSEFDLKYAKRVFEQATNLAKMKNRLGKYAITEHQ